MPDYFRRKGIIGLHAICSSAPIAEVIFLIRQHCIILFLWLCVLEALLFFIFIFFRNVIIQRFSLRRLAEVYLQNRNIQAWLWNNLKNKRINPAAVCDHVLYCIWLTFRPVTQFRCCVIFAEKPGFAMCVGCGSQIHDQYILRVSPDLEWHAACLKCAECSQYLDETCTCFVRDGKTYCKRDYVR